MVLLFKVYIYIYGFITYKSKWFGNNRIKDRSKKCFCIVVKILPLDIGSIIFETSLWPFEMHIFKHRAISKTI